MEKNIFVIIGMLTILTLVVVIAEDLYSGISIGIKTSKYPIENSNVNIEFYIWNKGNATFNGTVIYDFSGEKISWKENQQSITVYSNNYTLVKASIRPTYPGLYWANIKIKDSKDRQIYQTQDSLNVHSYGETATIGAAIIAFLSFIMYLIFKKK